MLHNLRRAVAPLLRMKRRRWRIRPPLLEFLRSDEYQSMMMHGLEGEPGLDEAELQTKNFLYRHKEVNTHLGVFRWRGLHNHLDEVLQLIEGAEKVIDFGGAGCPLGLDSVVVDLLRWDAAGYEIKHHDIKAWNGRADLVFSSHCLEHFEDLDEALTDLGAALTSEGKAVLLLPAHTCERWRAGVHQNKNFNDHRWTFCLSGDLDVPEIEHLVVIDDKVAEYMVVETAEYCGDNSIYIVASRAPSSA
ncbi:MAG TPA: methyltransferase domain-containing protein [Candidatus Poseidoniales archaeon]|nr:methyltransferase domain-containing protein [Candidatus Poseidoniales archaeon]